MSSLIEKDFKKFQEEALNITFIRSQKWMDENGISYNKDYPFGIPMKNGISYPSLFGKDDALKAYYVNIDLVLNGIVSVGFAHAKYLVDIFTFLSEKYPNHLDYYNNLWRAQIIYELSILRNARQIYGINGVNHYLLKNGLKPHHGGYIENWSESMKATKRKAILFEVFTDQYENTDYDPIEIEHCTNNDFCRAQVDYKEAVDNIIAITDSNGIMYLVMTVRGYAPSIGGLAFCGGMVDKIGDRALEALHHCEVDLEKAITENLDESIISEKRLLLSNAIERINQLSDFEKNQLESTIDASKSELDEEIGVEGNLSITNIFGTPVYEFTTPKMNIPNWDIRGFVPNGMNVTGFIKIYGNLSI
jgi:hypothetical protein